MKNKNSKLAIGIAISFEIIAISTVIIKIISRQWDNIHLLFLVIICITLPFVITYIANKYNFMLPPSFQLVSLSFILLAQYFGEFIQLYTTFSWWDLFLHGIFGCYAPIIGLHLMRGILTWDSEVTKKRFVIFTGVLTFCFTLALGVLWEIFEFLGDYFLKTGMTTGGLEDTMTDLIIKTLLALITTSIYSYKEIKNSN